MTTNRIKLIAIIFILLIAVVTAFYSGSPAVTGVAAAEEPAAVYKAKCAMCHSPKAEKSYDPAKSDEQHVEAILKGVKGAKPPFMPSFEAKGMTADEAKALAVYMRSLRQPAE
ncbi:cytochrome c [uncultured Arthrobacter sp.]|uniref:c-type cytochrome n=1 Tax=uncultured Arthrobacter sp. TaxID=114050 RepID=UPI0032180AFE